jgi:integrase
MKLISGKQFDLPEGKNDLIVFDDDLRGFALRVRRGAGDRIIRNWMIAYRASGHQRRMIVGDATILTAAQARTKAKKLLAEVELGGDPQGDRRGERVRSEVTLRTTIDRFLVARKDAKPNTMRMYQNSLLGPLGRRALRDGQKPYLAALHDMPLHKIDRRHVSDCLLDVAQKSGQPTAKMLRALLSGLFTWAMTMGLIEANPIVGAFKPEKSTGRDRVLSGEELASIWNAFDDDDYGKIVKLLICTGCRRGEIAQLCWSEIDLDKGTLTIPKERSKNGRAITLPITPLMMDIVNSVYRREGVDHLFGKRGFTDWSWSKSELDKRLQLQPWRIHDLRRTVATRMAEDLHIQPHIIETILNHQGGHKAGVAGIYNKALYTKDVRAAMLMWSDHIMALVEGKERKIVAFEQHLVQKGA